MRWPIGCPLVMDTDFAGNNGNPYKLDPEKVYICERHESVVLENLIIVSGIKTMLNYKRFKPANLSELERVIYGL